MGRHITALLVASLVPGTALASGTIECTSDGGEAFLSLTTGSLPVLAVVGAQIEAGGQTLSLNGEGEDGIRVGQAFRGHDEMRIDFTDPNVERVVAEVRLFTAGEGRDFATAGTLRIPESGAWAISCVGP